MRKSPTECRAGGRSGRECLSVVRQENEPEDQGEGVAVFSLSKIISRSLGLQPQKLQVLSNCCRPR